MRCCQVSAARIRQLLVLFYFFFFLCTNKRVGAHSLSHTYIYNPFSVSSSTSVQYVYVCVCCLQASSVDTIYELTFTSLTLSCRMRMDSCGKTCDLLLQLTGQIKYNMQFSSFFRFVYSVCISWIVAIKICICRH